ncbi:MAG: LysM peptidoglycan-binding domain-containing protein [Elusimicrobia bacterium]|nr:LysM peptidoglycan-binding domain-containing protein [Elusimicrobiota bacterium]
MITAFRLLAAAALLGTSARAAEPVPALRLAGTLEDVAGRPLFGSYLLHFRIFDGATGERAVWSESRYVKAEGGRFTAVLGRRRRLPASVLAGGYRLSVEAPDGTGWKAAAEASVEMERAAPVAETAAPARAAAATPAEPRGARRETEQSRRRLDALEKAMAFTKPAPEPAGPRLYVVQPGDNLRTVALKTLGDGRHWILIYQANRDRIQRAGELEAGQKLLIPALPP